MKSDDLFNDIDKKTAQWLSEDYPVLKAEQKERLYAMSKRKYDINDMSGENSVEVSGVEKYQRPKWYKFASAAAAAVLLVAGIGGSIAFISRNGNSLHSFLEYWEEEGVMRKIASPEGADAITVIDIASCQTASAVFASFRFLPSANMPTPFAKAIFGANPRRVLSSSNAARIPSRYSRARPPGANITTL